MAIRIQNKLTFIHVGKNAGTSISSYLRQNHTVEETGMQHDGWDQLPIEWRDNVFAVIRNPYDRMISFYFFIMAAIQKKCRPRALREVQLSKLQEGFEQFIIKHQNTSWQKNSHSPLGVLWSNRSQLRQLPDDLGKINLIRYENLKNELDTLFVRKQLSCPDIPFLNRSRENRNYRNFYTEETKDIVRQYYQNELDKFNYQF